VDEPSWVRQIRRERIWTAERLALERAARKGWAHGWAQQSPRTSRNSAAHRSGVLRIWRREVCGRTLLVIRPILGLTLRAIGYADVRSGILLPQSTILSGTKLDSRRLAPQRVARRGWPQDGPNNPPRTSRNGSTHRSGRFAYLAERSVDETTRVIRPVLGLILRTIGCADVRSAILLPQSKGWGHG
jgi:hypothetical protein